MFVGKQFHKMKVCSLFDANWDVRTANTALLVDLSLKEGVNNASEVWHGGSRCEMLSF